MKDKDFTLRIKAQITEAKKHQLQGLIIFLAADMTDKSVESKVNSIISDISQMNDSSLIVISPERAVIVLTEDKK